MNDISNQSQAGDLWQKIQANYGEKPEKPREVKKVLGKDDFLKIMIAQMKNQDPTNPFKAEQMATEMAQFTTVEQLQNIGKNIDKLADINKPIEKMSMTHLIGKMIKIDRQKFFHQEGENEYLSIQLPQDASKLHVSVLDSSGETAFEKELGENPPGNVSFTWDGIKTNGALSKSGEYNIRVDAFNERGKRIDPISDAKVKVIGISFEGSEPVFLVGDSQRQDKVSLQNIIRIESDDHPSLLPPQASLGSTPLGPSGVPLLETPTTYKNEALGRRQANEASGFREKSDESLQQPVEEAVRRTEKGASHELPVASPERIQEV